jgi:F-type H+-transporting ATPase subunit gamma
MANLKEIRNRISSVGSTMQITSAMKMVSAAKLKKAQDAIVAMRPYAETLSALLQNLSAALDGEANSLYTAQRPVKKVLAVVITSNRGLAGAFNSNVVKEAIAVTEHYADAEVDFMTLGKKGNDAFDKSGKVIYNNNAIFDDLNFESNATIAEQLMDKFTTGAYDKIVLIYNKFKNAATQIVMNENFLPLEPQAHENGDSGSSNTDFIFEPSQEEIVAELIPKSLKTQLFKALRDSVASEHGARMTAMHKATDNAKELKDSLTLEYNKARQAAITNEILEIVGGAEALAG